MLTGAGQGYLRRTGTAALDSALGRTHRRDPVLSGTGGPAGNASLTAWTGLLLLVLFLAELVTLLDLRGLISWHLVLGALLVPPAVVKVGTTGWRIARYYAHSPSYVAAGPPPLALRLLGPAVIGSTIALLGTGVALVYVGEQASRRPFAHLLGQRVDAVTLHQASFIVWAVATGLHVLARLVPAVQAVRPRARGRGNPPGRRARAAVLVAALVVGALTAYLVLGAAGDWTSGDHGRFDHSGDGRKVSSSASITLR